MFRYSEFILEKYIENLSEAKITFSKNFYNNVSDVNTEFSNKIISLVNTDIDIQYNYVDVTEEEDVVSFTPERRARAFIKEEIFKVISENKYLTNSERGRVVNKTIFENLGYEVPDSEEDLYKPEIGTIGKIISTTNGTNNRIYCLFECTEGVDLGKKSVLNKDALILNDNLQNIWNLGRNKIKVGRLIKAIAKSGNIDCNDSDIEKFVNSYKSIVKIKNDVFLKFDIVEGDDIAKWYSIVRYSDRSNGTLASSCMAEVPEDYFDIYVMNADVCKLVILYDDYGKINNGKYKSDKIIGRALLWKTRDELFFLDRIYTTLDSDSETFKRYADSKGWWYKLSQNSNNNFFIKNNQDSKRAELIVDLQKWKFDYYPYVDSIAYLNDDTGELSNDKGLIFKGNETLFFLNDTEGRWGRVD